VNRLIETYDVVLVGGGIMSATLGVLLRRVQPDWSILVLERLHGLGLESSAARNNAGTGHAGLCEFNYTPLGADGSIDVGSAIAVNEQFQLSRQLWARLVEEGTLGDPTHSIRSVPTSRSPTALPGWSTFGSATRRCAVTRWSTGWS
jgi:malate dehydrogenase (quinone)